MLQPVRRLWPYQWRWKTLSANREKEIFSWAGSSHTAIWRESALVQLSHSSTVELPIHAAGTDASARKTKVFLRRHLSTDNALRYPPAPFILFEVAPCPSRVRAM